MLSYIKKSFFFVSSKYQQYRLYSTMLRYTTTHEWIKLDLDKNIGTCGISQKAREDLGELVFMEPNKVDNINK